MYKWVKAAAAAAIVGLAASGCAAAGSSSDGGPSFKELRIMVPNSPGGGYDTTARTAAQVLEKTELTESLEVFNLEGAGGTVGLARTASEKGNKNLMMVMGLGLVGSVFSNNTDVTLADTTPIARLISEPEVIVVPKDSKYHNIHQLIADWKANPAAMPVGGGSSPGGPDHLAPHLLAKKVGIKPKAVNYVPYDGGGPLLAAILGGQVAFGVSGVGEFKDQIKAGSLRVLAVTSAKPLKGLDAPTLIQQGIDLEFFNWRGLVAPPGISDKRKQAYVDVLSKMQKTDEWQQAMARNGWTDAFMTGKDYAKFIQSQHNRVKSVLKDLGLL